MRSGLYGKVAIEAKRGRVASAYRESMRVADNLKLTNIAFWRLNRHLLLPGRGSCLDCCLNCC